MAMWLIVDKLVLRQTLMAVIVGNIGNSLGQWPDNWFLVSPTAQVETNNGRTMDNRTKLDNSRQTIANLGSGSLGQNSGQTDPMDNCGQPMALLWTMANYYCETQCCC
jgi:hypothetical protein